MTQWLSPGNREVIERKDSVASRLVEAFVGLRPVEVLGPALAGLVPGVDPGPLLVGHGGRVVGVRSRSPSWTTLGKVLPSLDRERCLEKKTDRKVGGSWSLRRLCGHLQTCWSPRPCPRCARSRPRPRAPPRRPWPGSRSGRPCRRAMTSVTKSEASGALGLKTA